MRHVVGVASAGRPGVLGDLVRSLAHQSTADFDIVVAVPDDADASDRFSWPERVRVLVADRGLTKQRNAILDALPDECQLVTFLDDDAVLASSYVSAVQQFAARSPSVVLFAGRVVADGAVTGPIERDAANQLLTEWQPRDTVEHWPRAYGCNMNVRADVARSVRFDERLPLYGWLEDRDFSARCARIGDVLVYDGAGMVHLGVSSGRVSGRRLGYSQVVNAWYLADRGSMHRREALVMATRALVANAIGAVRRDASIDRPGRLYGNLRGTVDVLLRRAKPERVLEL